MRRFLILMSLLLSLAATSQTPEADTLKLKASLSLSGIYQTGNVQTLIFRAKSDISYRPWRKWVYNNRTSYLYQAFDREKADQDIVSLNFLYFNPDQRFYPQLIGIAATNFRRRIDFRSLVGAGFTYRVFRKENNWLKISLSSEYENTFFSESDFNIDEYDGTTSIPTLRGTLWLNGRYHILGESIIFSHEAYIQPSLEESNNYRWQADLSLEFPLKKYLNFKINYLHTYENIVVADQKRQDRILTFGFNLKNYKN
ncbi:MAG: DUF481 domain-containing protein [Bacteroidota bacterium]